MTDPVLGIADWKKSSVWLGPGDVRSWDTGRGADQCGILTLVNLKHSCRVTRADCRRHWWTRNVSGFQFLYRSTGWTLNTNEQTLIDKYLHLQFIQVFNSKNPQTVLWPFPLPHLLYIFYITPVALSFLPARSVPLAELIFFSCRQCGVVGEGIFTTLSHKVHE